MCSDLSSSNTSVPYAWQKTVQLLWDILRRVVEEEETGRRGGPGPGGL